MLGAVGGTLALLLLIAIGFSLATGLSWMSVFERTGAALEGCVAWVRQRLAVRADRRAGVQAAQQRGALLGAPRQTVDLDGDDSGAPLIRPARLTGRAAVRRPGISRMCWPPMARLRAGGGAVPLPVMRG